jgi:hypothetical protein
MASGVGRCHAAARFAAQLASLALAMAAASRMGAQQPAGTAFETRVAGTVLQAAGTPIHGAVVRVDGPTPTALSDSAGHFTMVVRSSEITLHVRALGFVALDTSLVLTGRTLEPVLVMSRVITMLDTAHVSARATGKPGRYANTARFDAFYERKARSIGGSFLTREDIERADASEAVDLLRRVPGVRIQRSSSSGIARVLFPRCAGALDPSRQESSDGRGPSHVVQVFVDGTKVSEPFVVLSSLSASDVEAMEVYRGVAELPSEASGDGCAAIMIWTRYTPGNLSGAKP